MERREDGPFGEWRRTYNSSMHPVVKVNAILHRNDPIILGVVPQTMHIPHYFSIPVMAAEIWNVLEYAGIPDNDCSLTSAGNGVAAEIAIFNGSCVNAISPTVR